MNAEVQNPHDSPHLTKQRLLDAAERLFAQKGLHAVSTRDITTAAKANVGAINYHFGGKEGLILAVFARRVTPLNEKRLALLEALESTPKRITLEKVLDALIRPIVEDAFSTKAGDAQFALLISRVLGDAGETVEKLRRTHFLPVFQRFDRALQAVLPKLGAGERFWRMVYVFGAMHFMLLTLHQSLPEWPCHESNAESEVKRLVAFAAAGLRA